MLADHPLLLVGEQRLLVDQVVGFGLAGVASGLVIAYAAAALFLFWFLYSGRGRLTLRWSAFNREMFLDILKVGAISIETPDYVPVIRYAKSAGVKERLMHEAMNRAFPANIAVLDSLLAKRYRVAQILGYPTWADYITEDKMIKSARRASDFIDRVWKLASRRAKKDYAELLRQLRKTDRSAKAVADWQKTWLETQVKKARKDAETSLKGNRKKAEDGLKKARTQVEERVSALV